MEIKQNFKHKEIPHSFSANKHDLGLLTNHHFQSLRKSLGARSIHQTTINKKIRRTATETPERGKR
jgi:hypothetical protein